MVLFMNFEGIYAMNQQLRDDLLKLRYNGEQAVVEGVGKVMKKYIPFMRVRCGGGGFPLAIWPAFRAPEDYLRFIHSTRAFTSYASFKHRALFCLVPTRYPSPVWLTGLTERCGVAVLG